MNDGTFIKAILIILNVIIGILVWSLRSYFSTKTKNLAAKEDIRDISLEEHRGKLEAQATKATMAAITKADTNLEQLSLEIALEGVKKEEIEEMFPGTKTGITKSRPVR